MVRTYVVIVDVMKQLPSYGSMPSRAHRSAFLDMVDIIHEEDFPEYFK